MIDTRAVMRSLPLVASVLGRKYGVKVEIGGTDAYTDGTVIRLPSLPGDVRIPFWPWLVDTWTTRLGMFGILTSKL